MDLEQPVIRISVRNLVEFILRAGDIDNRIASTDKDTMQLEAESTGRFKADGSGLSCRDFTKI